MDHAHLEGDLAGMRTAQDVLLGRLAGLDDPTARRPSRLPGWTVGHVLTHIARNGDSLAWRLEGSARGEVVDQYPGGAPARAEAIEAGAARPAVDLVADIVATHRRLDAAVAAMTAERWRNETRDVGGDLRPAHEMPRRRWREVELHHVDLGLGYEPADWPAVFVERLLPEALADVGRRLPGLDSVEPSTVLAWTYGRAAPPDGLPELRPF
jgi:maleylpyruvate isomerase